MKVVIAEKIADTGIALLEGSGFTVVDATSADRQALLGLLADADALIIRSATKADAELLESAPQLKVVGRAGVGVDNVDLDVATRRGVVVVNAPQSNILSAAEHTIALILASARNVAQAHAALTEGRWERSQWEGIELHGKTLAILGLGKIGALVAQRMSAFGMRLVAYDPFVSKARAAQMGVELVTLDEALRQGDFITIHLPKTPETANLLDEKRLALCKPEARVINVARGGLVDEQALANAVSKGVIAGAAVDVFTKEPAPADNPLFGVPGIIVTPHLGASTTEAQDKAGVTIAEQVKLALSGELAPYAVNVAAGTAIPDEVKPFLPLAEILGRIAARALDARAELTIRYLGPIAEHDTRVVTLTALKGLLADVVHEPVTFVNAPLLAADRGLVTSEEKQPKGRDYVNQIEIEDAAGNAVSGTVVGVRNEPRITGIYDFAVEMPPGKWMCLLRYDDRPGVIGAIGSILGDSGVNISDMRVGRQEAGGEALMALAIDQPIDNEVLDRLRDGSGAKTAIFLSWSVPSFRTGTETIGSTSPIDPADNGNSLRRYASCALRQR
jgi:D-3-phosphoglycerate dehydrogenase / 2-oxoglutarate reductase